MLGDGEGDNVHDVVIENCDISNWGSNGAHESGTPPMQFGVKAYLPAGR